MALSVISWLFSLICEPGRDRLEETNIFDDDAGTSPRGVILAEQQSFTAFLSQLFSLLSRSLGSHPPSIHLMGLPALPSSLLREKRPRFVSSRALQALVKAGPGPDPAPDEDCYICLRPVGTKNLPSTSKVGLCGVVGAAKRDCAATGDDDDGDGDEIDGDATDREDDSGEKGRVPAPRAQRRHDEGGDGDCDEQSPKEEIQQQLQLQQQQQQQRLRRQSSPGSSGSSPRRSARQSYPRAILRLPCGHRYCDCCLRRWLSSHSSCPTCRWSFPERDCETVPTEF